MGLGLSVLEDFIMKEESERKPDAEVLNLCSRKEVGLLVLSINKLVAEAIEVGVRVVIDIEPILYESVLSILSLCTVCNSFWRASLPIVRESDGAKFYTKFSMFQISPPEEGEIHVVFVTDKGKDELKKDLELVVTNPRLVYFIVTPTRPDINITAAIYRTNYILETALKILEILDAKHGAETSEYREKKPFVGRIPYETLFFLPLDGVKKVVSTWEPPPPPNAEYLKEPLRSLEELVLPEMFKGTIKYVSTLLETERRGSLLLIGLPGSGRKTVSKTIAKMLSLPSYYVSLTNMLGKYVGESEGRMKAFFEGLRGRGGLAVFEGLEGLFKKTTNEQVSSNLKSILFQEMGRDDNNFIIVFTASEEASQEIMDSPLLGEVKMVMPLPTKPMRYRLARIFFSEISKPYIDKLTELAAKESITEAQKTLESLYVAPFVDTTAGFTPGEIYITMKTALVPALEESVKTGSLQSVIDRVIMLTKRDHAARQAKISKLKDKALAIGMIDVADMLISVQEEVSKLAREGVKDIDKYRMR